MNVTYLELTKTWWHDLLCSFCYST